MKIMKFGGTSVGSAERMQALAELLNDGEQKIVVLSAMSGTTNKLVEISKLLNKNDTEKAKVEIDNFEKHYQKVVNVLYSTREFAEQALKMIQTHFDTIRQLMQSLFTSKEEKIILAQGELLSTGLFFIYLKEKGINTVMLPALNFMRIDKNKEPDEYFIKVGLERELELQPTAQMYITQGFIARSAVGEIDNLGRGGSDYSASLIGAALEVDEIQIWTDISGIHTNDPRYVQNTRAISELSFDEAAELAYFGAKILHPTSVLPAKMKNIPVRLKNTMQPEDAGTLISDRTVDRYIKAVAAKDGITAVKIKSGRMLLAYGFLRRVFEVFERYCTPIDMITTSEIAVSVTIDDTTHLKNIIDDLSHFGSVEVDNNQTIVCVVGNLLAKEKGVAYKVLEALKDVPVRMISYGGSEHNISVLLNTSEKIKALTALNTLFEE